MGRFLKLQLSPSAHTAGSPAHVLTVNTPTLQDGMMIEALESMQHLHIT